MTCKYLQRMKLETLKQTVRIYCQNKEWNLLLKMYDAHNEQWKKIQQEVFNSQIKKRIRMFGDKVNYKYLRILEVVTIELEKTKGRIRKQKNKENSQNQALL